MKNKINLIFDIDGTLIFCSYTYNIAMAKVLLLILKLLNEYAPNPTEILKYFGKIDLENARKFGFGDLSRFPSSWVETARYFFKINNLELTKNAEEKIKIFAKTFIINNYKLMPNVKETLEYFYNQKDKYNLFIMSAGDKKLQNYKLDNTGIRKYFDGVFIVSHKNIQTYKYIIKENNLDKKYTFMIGNSKAGDVYPSINCGINAVYIKAEAWKFDNANVSSKNYVRLKELKNLIPYMEQIEKKL